MKDSQISCLTLFKEAKTEYDPKFPINYLPILFSRKNFRTSAIEKLTASFVIKSISMKRRKYHKKEFLKEFTEAKSKSDSNYEKNKLSKAQKILEKFGWRPGNGLGKNKQGITAALVIQKIDTRTAVITTPTICNFARGQLTEPNKLYRGKQVKDQQHYQSKLPRRLELTSKTIGISSVILLNNMVVSGKVDKFLGIDTKNECTRYGKVKKILIFEVIGSEFPGEDSVKIFVNFSDSGEINNAVADLNFRWFGGRKVSSKLYSIEKFNNKDLASKKQ